MVDAAQPWAGRRHSACVNCNTELAPHALTCPACLTLVHSERLKDLARRAETSTANGALGEARQLWEESLTLLPATSRQHAVISARVADLSAPAASATVGQGGANARGTKTWWKTGAAAIATLALLLIGKLKFLLLGLTKAKTFLSMFAFFGVYWTAFGWPLALGLVVSIYIHEMGHVAALRKLNIAAGAPLFIPGVGAFVLLKQHIDDPRKDAFIGLAGPVWGLAAAIAALAVYAVTGTKIWLAIGQLTGFINLFNLIPVWQLDGARGFHVLTRAQRWAVVLAIATAFLFFGQKLLLIVGVVAVWRAFKRDSGPGDNRAVATFVVLVAALSWISMLRAV